MMIGVWVQVLQGGCFGGTQGFSWSYISAWDSERRAFHPMSAFRW